MCKILTSLPTSLLLPVLLALSFTAQGRAQAQTTPSQPPATPSQPPTIPSQPPANNAPQPPTIPTQPPASNAPPQLTNLISQIDAAANQKNIKALMQFFSPNFTHSDGLTRQNMAQTLTQLWQRYPNLKYQTQVQSWKPQGNAIVAETVTNITGAQSQNPRDLVLNATIRSRQRYQDGKIVSQEILSENSQLKIGQQPPTVQVKLPQQVKPGQQYNFDAIVQEPLGEDYLLGAVLEEPIEPENYLNSSRVDLELLSAGGLFKIGRAPVQPEDLWISAILIRGNGMTLVTQRLDVAGQKPPAAQKPASPRSQNLGVKGNN